MTRKEWQPDQQQSREEGPQQHATPQSGLIALKTPTDDACITEVMSVSEGILSVRWDHSDEKKMALYLGGRQKQILKSSQRAVVCGRHFHPVRESTRL